MYKKFQRIHFVGIGGIGMSGIAEVLHNLGYAVTGSDASDSENTRRLAGLGIAVWIGHAAANVEGAHVVVRSSAVGLDNVEVAAARHLGIPVIQRGDMLAELMRLKYGVAVAGTHGKTTTTSMVATVLARGGFDPTMVVGGRLNVLGTNAKLGRGDFLVAEADESDGSFLKLAPTIAVVTTIDAEHLDYYRDLSHIKESFLAFINKVPFYGVAVLCADQGHIRELLPRVEKRVVTYGLTAPADLAARDVRVAGLRSAFTVVGRGRSLGRVHLRVPGLHNVANALAAVGVGLDLDIGFDVIAEALEEFAGVARRFQVKGEANGILVVDDYGHHPAEIRATLAAARSGFGRRIVVAFQPHRFTRTHALLAEFFPAFAEADVVTVTEIYPAGEPPIAGVSGRQIAEGVRAAGHPDVTFLPEREAVAAHLREVARPGDLVLTLGAGDIWKAGDEFLRALGAPAPFGEGGRGQGFAGAAGEG